MARRRRTIRRTCEQIAQLHDLTNQHTREAAILLYEYANTIEDSERRISIIRCASRMEMLAELAAEME